MKLALIILAAMVALLLAVPAQAHKNYCGHSAYEWMIWSYGTPVYYAEIFQYDYNSGGVHFHVTDVVAKSGGGPYKFIHSHIRACGSTPA